MATPVLEKADRLTVNEIYASIQGESSWAGWPCVFVRLTFCNLRCTYCDTAYAFYEGDKKELTSIVDEVLSYRIPMVEVTGGEPLLQPAVIPLMKQLCDHDLKVLLETSGAQDIQPVDPRVHRIMDLKTPSSGECEKNREENIEHLTKRDEVKFVLGSEEDYEWAKSKVECFRLDERCHNVLFSTVFGQLDPRQVVDWMVRDQLNARFQLQMHKYIWDPKKRSV